MANDEATSGLSIREQVRNVVDPTGKQFMMLAALDAIPDLHSWLATLDREVAGQFASMAGLRHEHAHLVHSMEDALEVLVPRGWAPFNMKTDIVGRAVDLVRQGLITEADELLADQWEDGHLIDQTCVDVSMMGAGEGKTAYHLLFQQRARLLRKAKDHHEAGRYEASIPLLHAQMEGLVIDLVPGKKFFTQGWQKADMIDPTQLVGMEACLAALQMVFGESTGETQTAGSLSRHAIAHGRELAYDTRTNSAKTWSVMHALVQWARPLAKIEAENLRKQQEAQNAGLDGRDADGRRLDRREFNETKRMLRKLLTGAMPRLKSGEITERTLVGDIYTSHDFIKAGLPADHGIQTLLSVDTKTISFWRATPSGWIIGAAVGATEHGFQEWLYSGAIEPSVTPENHPQIWGKPFETPADWRP